ncbi:MAG: DUF805 domain-containing protein [Bacteroidales bacterium]|jgi:uncharacterized membrane protein YhaH (DUF805 family)|nr:DUF805 domain-containing protein [Bacteroidales bacterium]
MNEMIENFKDIITNKYAQFNGRANKAEFWQYILVYILISIALSLLMSIFARVGVLRMLFWFVNLIVMLALIIPSLAVGVRRMHDIGKDGMWVLINLIPLVGTIWFIVLAVQDSEPGANRFDR